MTAHCVSDAPVMEDVLIALSDVSKSYAARRQIVPVLSSSRSTSAARSSSP